MNSHRDKRMLIISHRDITRGGGQVAKAKTIQSVFRDHWHTELFGFKGFSDTKKTNWVMLGPQWISTLIRKVIGRRIDVVYCVNQRHIIVFLRILRLLAVQKYRIVYDTELSWVFADYSDLHKKLRAFQERLAGRSADLVAANSDLAVKFFSRIRNQVILVPNFVQSRIFKANPLKRVELRFKYGYDASDRVVGVIGPFYNSYNTPALDFVYNNRFDQRIKFLVIGVCPEEFKIERSDITYTDFVSDYVEHLSCLDAVLVFRRIRTDGAIARIVESMSVGLPVFTNMIAFSAMDHLTAGTNILAFEDNELCDKMSELIFDDNLMSRLGQSGQEAVEQFYSQEIMAHKLLKTFDELRRQI